MPFSKQDVTLFWAIEPVQADWDNLEASGVRRLMLTYGLAKDTPLLQRLAALGLHVAIRLEPDLEEGATQITATLFAMSKVVVIDAVILGNEPDGGLDWHFDATGWYQQAAYALKWRTDLLRRAVEAAGLRAVSPAFSCPPEAISEDGELRPARYTWLEIVRPVYDMCDGNAAHVYALGWGGDAVETKTNEDRYKQLLKEWCESLHKLVWLDEVGVILEGNNVAQMTAYCRMADILLKHPAGKRVEMFCPFISAGDPQGGKAWDGRYLLKDPAAYRLLGEWMRT